MEPLLRKRMVGTSGSMSLPSGTVPSVSMTPADVPPATAVTEGEEELPPPPWQAARSAAEESNARMRRADFIGNLLHLFYG